MHDKYKDLKRDGVEAKEVRLINGTLACIPVKRLVGFCRNGIHRGFLNKNLLVEHQCIEKACPFFEKFEDYPYWTNLENQERATAKKKQRDKERRQAEEEKLTHSLQMMEAYIYEHIIERGYPIEITRVSMLNDGKKSYVLINYVSRCSFDDSRYYQSIRGVISLHFCKRSVLRHVKAPNGEYVTTEQWHDVYAEKMRKSAD
ncbi:MAG: hypothetical protein LIO57_08955 [Oscillospiraceae bacterium]|nr:hypothetical protein [Oscillospiraceae bacterium]